MDAEVLSGSGKALGMAELYRLHAASAGRLAYFLLGNREAAEDLVHDAFIKVLGRWGHLRKRDSFSAYLNKTIVNLSKNHHRHRSVERAYLEKEKRAAQETIVPSPDMAEKDELWTALQALPHRQRAAIVLRFFGDLSEHQTADVLDCSPAAVNSMVSRGLDTLRSIVPDLGV